ncbi:TIGR03086 family metal-binding protein [Streptomyces sp. NPDC005438]|uniref:TIGR03086 family metal-binding protein n=1 Tax=Streptomyces sp. NPDC005438 TaxID=3156880 RepID=UPI0033AA6678
MELLDAFDTAQAEFGRLVHRVGADQWSADTPCAQWTVRDLVNHLTSEHLWAPWLLEGATLEEVGDRYDGDVLDGHPVDSWDAAASRSHAAFHVPSALDPDVRVHTSGGPSPVTEYAWQMTTDLTVHSWDLARGLGEPDELDEELTRTVHQRIAPQVDTWQGLGIFDPPVEVPASAGPTERLVALLGRDPRQT